MCPVDEHLVTRADALYQVISESQNAFQKP